MGKGRTRRLILAIGTRHGQSARATRIAGTTALLLSILVGCSSASSNANQTPPAVAVPSPTPAKHSHKGNDHSIPDAPSTHSAVRPHSGDAPFRVSVLHRVRIPKTPYVVGGGRMAFWGHYLAYVEDGEQVAHGTRVVVVDLHSETRSVVARTTWRRGQVYGVAGTGNWVVWADEARVTSDRDRAVRWKFFALNLVSGERRTLASSGDRREWAYPWPVASDGRVVWEQQIPGKVSTLALRVANLTTGRVRTLLRSRHLIFTSVGLSGSRVCYWYGRQTPPARGRLRRGDAYCIPARGGEPVQVTHTGKVRYPKAGYGYVTYEQPLYQPTSVWVARVDGEGSPVRLLHPKPRFLIQASVNNRLGKGFLAYWWGPARLGITPLDTPEPMIIGSHLDTWLRFAVSGDRVAWASYEHSRQGAQGAAAVITVARVTRK